MLLKNFDDTGNTAVRRSLLCGYGLVAMSYLIVQFCALPAARAEPPSPPSNAVRILAETAAPVKSFTLPGGKALSVRAGSLCEQLVTFLQTGSEFDMPTFIFADLSFGAGSTKIQEGSEAELQSLSEILRAYAEMRFTLRGQTEGTGDADMNKELSLRRAESVKDALIERGVAETRIRVQGIGPEDPLAPNATVRGRQKNRRTELQVTYR